MSSPEKGFLRYLAIDAHLSAAKQADFLNGLNGWSLDHVGRNPFNPLSGATH